MGKFTMRHDLECDEERHWKLFFDREFNTKLFSTELGFPKWEMTELREEEKEIVRIVKATPKLDAPAAVAKLLGPGFGYVEEGHFDRATKTLRFVIKPSALESKLRNEGTVRVESRGEGKCTRVVDIVAEAKIFGLGGMIESMSEKSFRDGWGKSAAFINRWVKEHPEG